MANHFNYYIDLHPIEKHVIEQTGKSKNIDAVYRETISMYVYMLHHIILSKSFPRLPIQIGHKEVYDPNSPRMVCIQNKLRVFSKNEGVLINLCHVLKKFTVFSKSSNISQIRKVPESVLGYEIIKRVRIPSVVSGDQRAIKAAECIKANDRNNYINLMTSSGKSGNKRFMRYYYTKIAVDRDNYTGKLDGYGFSRHKNKICIPIF